MLHVCINAAVGLLAASQVRNNIAVTAEGIKSLLCSVLQIDLSKCHKQHKTVKNTEYEKAVCFLSLWKVFKTKGKELHLSLVSCSHGEMAKRKRQRMCHALG